MTGDSTAPQTQGPSANASASADKLRRPHALDDDHDDWSTSAPTIFTLRNAGAAALTIFTSTLLGVGIGLPNSVPAMIGVWIATALLFGPLWYALFHQNYTERLRGPGQDSSVETQAASETQPDDSPNPEVFVATVSESNREPTLATTGDSAPAADGSSTSDMQREPRSPFSENAAQDEQRNPLAEMAARVSADTQPSATPLPSYYQPMNQFRSMVHRRRLSPSSYGVVLLFSAFVGVIVLASPFLAAVIVRVWLERNSRWAERFFAFPR